MNLLKKLFTKKRTEEGMVVKKINPYLGVEITNIRDITEISSAQFSKIKEMITASHLVVIKGNRKWTEQEQINFTNNIGTLELPIAYSVPACKVPAEQARRSFVKESSFLWHSDRSYVKNPPHLSVFQMIQIPKDGTKTSFISLIKSYKDMPEIYQKEWTQYFTQYSNEVTHPIIWRHPYNGEKTIYFDFGFASIMTDSCKKESLPTKETNEVLNFLNTLFSNQESMYEHQWDIGDIIIVDNYAMAHKADINLNDGADSRILLRTTTEGIYF